MTDSNLMEADCIHGMTWYDCKTCCQQEPENKPFNTTPRAETTYTVVMEFVVTTIGTREQAIDYAAHARKFLKLQLSKSIKLTKVSLQTLVEGVHPEGHPFMDKAIEIVDINQLNSPEL